MSFSDYMEWKTLIEASYIYNINTGGKSFSRLLLLKDCESFQRYYYHKALHLGCCSSPRSASAFVLRHIAKTWSVLWSCTSLAFLEKRRPNKRGEVKHELRVTSSNLRVTTSNLRVTNSDPRVRRLKTRVARLKARVGRPKARVRGWKARVRRLKGRVEAIKPRVR